MNALDVVIRCPTNFKLELRIALCRLALDILDHGVWYVLADGAIENNVILCRAAQQIEKWLPRGFSQEISAGNIHGRLGIGMAKQCGVHDPIDLTDIERVLPNEPGCHLCQPSPNAEGE